MRSLAPARSRGSLPPGLRRIRQRREHRHGMPRRLHNTATVLPTATTRTAGSSSSVGARTATRTPSHRPTPTRTPTPSPWIRRRRWRRHRTAMIPARPRRPTTAATRTSPTTATAEARARPATTAAGRPSCAATAWTTTATARWTNRMPGARARTAPSSPACPDPVRPLTWGLRLRLAGVPRRRDVGPVRGGDSGRRRSRTPRTTTATAKPTRSVRGAHHPLPVSFESLPSRWWVLRCEDLCTTAGEPCDCTWSIVPPAGSGSTEVPDRTAESTRVHLDAAGNFIVVATILDGRLDTWTCSFAVQVAGPGFEADLWWIDVDPFEPGEHRSPRAPLPAAHAVVLRRRLPLGELRRPRRNVPPRLGLRRHAAGRLPGSPDGSLVVGLDSPRRLPQPRLTLESFAAPAGEMYSVDHRGPATDSGVAAHFYEDGSAFGEIPTDTYAHLVRRPSGRAVRPGGDDHAGLRHRGHLGAWPTWTSSTPPATAPSRRWGPRTHRTSRATTAATT